MNAFERAISTADTQQQFADLLGVSPQVLTNWKRRGVPLNRILAVERATGGQVSRHELCPEYYPPPAEQLPMVAEA